MGSHKKWKNAIEVALIAKGFSKKGAKKTAASTIQKSLKAKAENTPERREERSKHGKVVIIMKDGVRLRD